MEWELSVILCLGRSAIDSEPVLEPECKPGARGMPITVRGLIRKRPLLDARIASAAAPGQVLVLATVKKLVVRSDILLLDFATHRLKGVPELRHLYELATRSSGYSARIIWRRAITERPKWSTTVWRGWNGRP